MMLTRVRIRRQLGTLSRLKHRKNDGANKGPDELRDGLVDVEDAKVDTRELACGSDGVVGGGGEEVVGAAVLEVEGVGACELDGGGFGGGEAAVGGRVAGDFVNFHAHHCYGGP